MGGSSQTQKTDSTTKTEPWAPTIPQLNKALGALDQQWANVNPNAIENSALSGLSQNAAAGNPYAPAIGSLATDLLSGGTDRTGMAQSGYDRLESSLTPYTTMDTNPYSNEAFTKFTQSLTDDINNQIKSQYAGAGYSPVGVGDYAQTLGRGISQGIAPAWLQASNDLENRKGSAIRDLYSGSNTSTALLSGLDQTALGNRQAGIGASTAAQQAKDSSYERQLQIEAQRRGLPLQNIGNIESLLLPIAQTGGTSNTQATTTTEKDVPLGQQILGGAMGGVGLLGNMGAFGPTGWLLGGGSGLLGGASAAGAGLTGSASAGASALLPLLAFSDRRIKTDILRVGRLDNGLPFYMFRYIGDNEPRFGVMAQDVEKVTPDAVIELNGLKMVDYNKAVRAH